MNSRLNKTCCLVIGAIVVLVSDHAQAWRYVEHAEIGTAAYRRACKRIRALVQATDVRAVERLALACSHLRITAGLYGQASALAGDRLDKPEDFLARGGDWKVGSKKHYYLLQLVDTHHYHPSAPREWDKHHRIALALAEKAARTRGLELVNAFEKIFYRNAFADHFLQDAFAAGHMGFNRTASSIAATQAFHDLWNKRGRRIRDRAGSTWMTYGDGKLNHASNKAGREHVINAAAASVYDVLGTFVRGRRDYKQEIDTWKLLPYLIDARPSPSLLGFDDEDANQPGKLSDLRPLQSVSWPARVDEMIDVGIHLLATRQSPREPTVAILVGLDVALPFFDTRTHVSVGGTTPHDSVSPRFAAQLEVRRDLALSFDGLLNHQLSAGFVWEARGELAGWFRGTYTVQLELGLHAFKLEVGPTYDLRARSFGYSAGLAYGRAVGVAGGGTR